MTTPTSLRKSNQSIAPATPSLEGRVFHRSAMTRHLTARPVLVGDRNYLRALRAAEMAAWNAGRLLGRKPMRAAAGNGRL